MFAGSYRVGNVLLRPGNLDLDSIVKLPSLFNVVVTFILGLIFEAFHSNDILTSVKFCYVCVLLYTSDISQSCTPAGRSMFTMTPISDHTLFMYGGVSTNRNTLSKSQPQSNLQCPYIQLQIFMPHVCCCMSKSQLHGRIMKQWAPGPLCSALW